VVRLRVSEEELARRAEQTGREADLALALRIDDAYKQRTGADYLEFNTSAHSVEDIARSIMAVLPGLPRGQA
ncbi:MAG TPA: hypothetical protein VH916_13065, partial [Dehalococcoidia bacterium]